MTRRFGHPFVFALLALVLVAVPVASSMANTSASSYHWARARSRFTLKVGDNVSGNWDRLLSRAIADWNKNGTVTLDKVNGQTGANCHPVRGRVEVCSSSYGTREGWLGLTRLYLESGHVEAATVQMNDSYLNARGNSYDSNAARRHTICHELGHAIGLDHVDTRSCMNNSQYAVFNYVNPIRRDFRQLERIYSHRDGKTTIDSASVTGESFVVPTSLPAAPSRVDVPETVTVQRLDDRRTVVTFIIWAKD